MPDLGPAELLIVLAIVMLVFGSSRLADLGGALGKSVREFKKATREDDDEPGAAAIAAAAPAIATGSVEAQDGLACSNCGAANLSSARFCCECGQSLSDAASPAQPAS